MSDTITITGLVATTPRHIVTSEGLAISSFRLASTQRRYDTTAEKWIDGDTNWYTVTCFRHLATHVAESVNKAERVVVVGKLRIREWETEERRGMSIEVEADALGHDLTWGTAVFTSTPRSAIATEAGSQPVEEGDRAVTGAPLA